MQFDDFKNILDQREAEKRSLEEDVEQYFLDYSAEISKPKVVINDPTNTERIIVSEDNILVITGEAKSYKSFCASLLVIDFFKQHPTEKCIIIDTEQADWNCANIGHRVCKGMGWRYADAVARKQLRVANLRRFSYEERKAIVEKIIVTERPYLCIIDGIRDLVRDINDSQECTDIIDKLMSWTAEQHCAIGTIIHTNKDGETIRGHLGTELQNKAETVLFCKKKPEGNGVEVSSKYARNIDIDTFSIEINEQYVPVRSAVTTTTKMICGTPKETKALNDLQLKSNVSRIEWITDIRTAAMCAQSTAEKYFADYVQGGFLIPMDKEGHFFSHFATTSEQPKPMTEPIAGWDNFEDNQTPF